MKTRYVGLFLAGILLLGGLIPAAAQPVDDLIARYGAAMHPDHVDDLTTEAADRPQYTLDVTLTADETAAVFDGALTVSVTNTSPDPWDEIVLRLYPNLPSYGGLLEVTAARVAGEPVTPDLDGTRTALSVPLAAALPPGEVVEIGLDFTTTIYAEIEMLYAQFSYLDGVIAAPNFFPLLSVYEADEGGWWRTAAHPQGDAVYSATAFFDVTLTAPADLVLATSGVTVDTQPAADAATQYTIIAPLMRDFALMASADFTVHTDTVDGVAINVYSYVRDSYGQAGVNLTYDAVHIYDAAFGAYPYAELDMVETATRAGGIEYPGLIVIAEQVWNPANRYFQFVIAHEVAHQWWYSLVGNDQTGDPWLDEALAQYSVLVYFEDLIGPAARASTLASFEQSAAAFMSPGGPVIGLPVALYDGDNYSGVVYQKGPLFFQAIADLVGEDALQAALQDYFAAYRYEIAEPGDLLASFEASLGQDLDDLFLTWVGELPTVE